MDRDASPTLDIDRALAHARRRAEKRDRKAAGKFEGHVTYRGVDIGSRESLVADIIPVKLLLDVLDRFTLRAIKGVLVDGDGRSYMMLAAPGRFNGVMTEAVERAVLRECDAGEFPDFDNFTILSDDGVSRVDFGRR